MIVAGGVSEVVAPAAGAGAGVQPWPSRGAAYYALLIVILATLLNFLDAQVFGMMAQRIKVDFHLTDEQLGFLIGPANVIFYVLIGIPMARLVDIYPRKIVLASGIAAIGGITALGGLAQSFSQLFCSRMLVGAGGSAHAPGAYSILSDYFPPAKLPRAIGFLQLGFIGGNALGIFLGGQLVSLAAAWPVSHWMGLTVHGWQWILMMVGAPGLLISGMLLLVKEPARRGVTAHGKPLPVAAVLREIRARKAIYLPLFIGLAFSATQAIGMLPWRAPFLIRTYGWNEAKIGRWMGIMFLTSSLNAAIQRITPNEMRGQVTAIYLFMFIVFGALGSQLVGSVTQRVFGSDADLWKSIVMTASVLMPLAAFAISRGIKPYGREVERLEREAA